jgi:hypothetical protein
MSQKDWVNDTAGWPVDPKADKNCPECRGSGVIQCFPPPSGMQDVLAECFRCIPDRSEESKRATAYLEEPK